MSTLIGASPQTASKQATVLYDGECPLCRKGKSILERLDWLGRLRFQDARDESHLPATHPPLNRERLLEEMHLVTPDGRQVLAGFECFRWMAWRLPLCIPLAPMLYLPGVPSLGQRLYLWIARHRFNLAPCTHGECRLPASEQTTTPS